MTNAFFNADGSPVTRSRGRSDVMRSEFTRIEQGFDDVETSLDTKLPKASPASTGTMTHTGGDVDLTAASEVLVPTPAAAASGHEAVNASWVTTAIGSVPGAVPPQAGHEGAALATDGTTNYWQGGGVAGIAYALFAQGVI